MSKMKSFMVIAFFCLLAGVILMPKQADAATVDYYVSTTGSDSPGTSGLSGSPWLTLANACSRVPASNGTTINTIHVLAGTFTESSVCNLNAGVNLVGAGVGQTTIKSTITHNFQGSPWNWDQNKFLIRAINSSNIIISDFKLDGLINSTPTRAHAGIMVHNGSNVTIRDVEISNFDYTGIYASALTYSTVYNAKLTDSGLADSIGSSGSIKLGDISDSSLHDMIIRDTRGGDGIDTYKYGWTSSNNSTPVMLTNVNFYNLDINVRQDGAWGDNQSGITIELWKSNLSNVQIYNNLFNDSLSIPHATYSNGVPTVTAKVFNNQFIADHVSGSKYTYAIEAGADNMQIYNNYFKNGIYPISSFNSSQAVSGHSVHHNIFDAIENNTVFNYPGLQNSTLNNNIVIVSSNLQSNSLSNFSLFYTKYNTSQNVDITDNILINENSIYNDSNPIVVDGTATLGANFNVNNNLFYRWKQGGTNSFEMDPYLSNASPNKDYRLRYDSLALALGIGNVNTRSMGLRSDFTYANANDTLSQVWAEPVGSASNDSVVRLTPTNTVQLNMYGRTVSGYVASISSSNITYGTPVDLSGSNVISINSSGLITANNAGKAKVTVSVTKGSVTRTSTIYVFVSQETQAPIAPTNLTATTFNSSRVDLTWTASTDNVGVAGYMIFHNGQYVATASGTSYSDVNLIGGTNYSYRIKAIDAAGNVSADSNIPATVTTTSNLAYNKTVSVSNYYQNNATYNGQKAIDMNGTTRWATDNGVTSAWLEIDFGYSTTFNRTILKEAQAYGNRINAYQIQYWDSTSTSWVTVYTGGSPAATQSDTFSPVTSNKVRLNITGVTGSNGPTVWEFEVYNVPNLALNKTTTASSEWNSSNTFYAFRATDGKSFTRWSAASGQVNNQYLTVDFGSQKTFGHVLIQEPSGYTRVTAYKLQYSTNGITFTDISGTSGTTIGTNKFVAFTPVTASHLRLYITSASAEPTMQELIVFEQ
ncbi:discoidin domain-containing protein [Paenibacillus roseipurpureus]|uniref:Discoidin domain-containing protein n=1 Tax=Paenibacillus roseopurpureus TaxID=2918901 RepID=A0AA96RLH2_9BACL|nr:discoidin domain-containing protein [Paenibacillus sp. MBLB1832]WNR45409.1 discoidin domain-containing protein [Paenibacillus sp. MBLB1832]